MHDRRAHQRRHMDEGVACRPAGLDQADTRVRLFRQSRGEHAPRRARANNDILELGVNRHGDALRVTGASLAPAKRQRQ
jgi:hypothetical protein